MISKVANKPPCRDRRLIAMPPCHCLRRLCLALLDQSLVLLKKLYSHALAPAKKNTGLMIGIFLGLDSRFEAPSGHSGAKTASDGLRAMFR